MMTDNQYVTPLVKKLAATYGVPLDGLTGTGVSGRVTKRDVELAAVRAGMLTMREQQVIPGSSSSAPAPMVGKHAVQVRSQWDRGQTVTYDSFSRNPLVDDARQALSGIAQTAMRENAAPTLFASGDLPLFIASGADPQLLLQLPWNARHAAAEADASSFARMLSEYSCADGEMLAVLDGVDKHDGNIDYRSRVQLWLAGR
jgi:hypothetical protein